MARMLSTTSLAVALIALACVPDPAAESGNDDVADSDSESDTGTPEERGAALYDKYCAFCHGDVGQGYTADNANALSNQEFLRIASDDFLATSIRYGRPGTSMSAWGEDKAGPLSDQDIDDIVTFIRTWQELPSAGPEVDAYEIDETASILRGETYYGVYGCEDCHGIQGVGGTFMTLENPWFLTTVSDGYLRESIVRGRPGTPMPSYQSGADTDLSDLQVDDIIKLIRSWEREPNTDPLPPFEPDVSDAVINPDGPDPDFVPVDGRFIGADLVKSALDMGAKMILLDARPHADYVDGHLEGAVSIPFFDLPKVIDELPQDVWIINYCGCPHAVSGQSFDALAEAGFTNIAVLDEGYYYWVEQGYPIVEGE
ncbi:hypothetical protein PPSIR1_28478 [Plesiocystis pacifica SIR-1]|uniref:Uncharacterized protein n=1 Tax=Plesiocystis pacifica SIR-1 TaxID=391625 RepID=A6FZW8_9BACT|nr:c-type cytochrome [Plesiocystis pacifica]EDM80924.1 hypothetical protein PPSIR1_28478 [Plesiocystis pacifica SIR-1]